MTKNTTLFSIIALSGLFGSLTSGCKQEVLCPELGNCGGPTPYGSWELKPGSSSCVEDLYVPPSDPRLIGGGDVPAARTPPPEPALFDWCDNLVTSNGTTIQARAAIFYSESAPVGAATIRFDTNGSWSSGITRTGTFVLDFPALCIREFGATDGKLIDPMHPELGTGNVCKQLEVPLGASGRGPGSYQNTTCEPNPADPAGCLCAFDVQETGGPSGSFQQINGNTLLLLSDKTFPAQVTFCNSGGHLQLTGTDGEYMFGTKGLRTMDLAKVVANCSDGKQGPGELGIDCGDECPNACPAPATP